MTGKPSTISEVNPHLFLNDLIKILPTLYKNFGYENNKTTKLRLVINQMLDNCENIIKEGNQEYRDFLKKRIMK